MVYETRIHVNGEFIVGRYPTEIEAAVAYNKAASTLLKKGYERNYPVNYLDYARGYVRNKKTDARLLEEAKELAKRADIVLLCVGLDEISNQNNSVDHDAKCRCCLVNFFLFEAAKCQYKADDGNDQIEKSQISIRNSRLPFYMT